MTPDGIKSWLSSISKDRQWLAERLKATKGTVDQWFSKGFPDWAVEMIKLIQTSSEGKLELRWTADEWREIQEAMANAGYTNEFSFFHDGILFFADSINTGAAPETPLGIVPIATLAEEPTSYAKRQAKRKA